MKKTNLRPNLTLLFIRGMVRLAAIIGILVLIAVGLGALSSCSSVKKARKSEMNKRDSVATISETALSSRTKDSIGERTAKTIQAGNTIIELDDEDQGGVWYSDSTIKKEKINPADYAPTSITLPGGGQIITRQRIKSITTSGNATSEEKTKAEVHNKDTSSNVQTKSVSVKNESGSSSSNIRRTNWTGLIIGSIILFVLLIAGRIIYKQYFEKNQKLNL